MWIYPDVVLKSLSRNIWEKRIDPLPWRRCWPVPLGQSFEFWWEGGGHFKYTIQGKWYMVTINCTRYGKKKWTHWQENMVIIFLTGPEWAILSPPSLPPPPKKTGKTPLPLPSPSPIKKNKMIVKSYQFDLKKKFRKLSSFYILEREFRNIPRWG